MPDDDFVMGAGEYDEHNPEDAERARGDILRQRAEQQALTAASLRRRREAYIRLFVGGNPTGDDVQIVMSDLKAFCRGNASAFHPDERVHCVLTGRQEVFLRIMDHTGLDFDALLDKYTAPLAEG